MSESTHRNLCNNAMVETNVHTKLLLCDMQKVLITGGSGLLGRALTQTLQQKGYEVAWLGRRANNADTVKQFQWNIEKGQIDTEAIAWADVLIHLAGTPIADKRWTKKRKADIVFSRVQSTKLLIESMQRTPHHIHTVIAASAVGWYGHAPVPADEQTPAGTGFLSDSVHAWEQATDAFAQAASRFVRLRIGVVLAPDGGAYPELTQTAGLRTLPVIGGGKQHVPWIHVEDIIGMFVFAIEHPISGTFNGVAPKAVPQKELMHLIGNAKGGWYFYAPVPVFFIRALLGELADTVLIDQQVSAEKIMTAGYRYVYPECHLAIKALTQAAR